MRLAELVGRTIALATMYGKERAFGSVRADRLGVEIVVPMGLDTDMLGTFTSKVHASD